eukprot:8306107-Heterocapsa_arctica.AAC.1
MVWGPDRLSLNVDWPFPTAVMPAVGVHLKWVIYDSDKHNLSDSIAEPFYRPPDGSGKDDWMQFS